MTKFRLTALAAVLGFPLSGASLAQVAAPVEGADLAIYARPQRLVALPDGRHMNLYCTGEGRPTVILEGGWTTTTMWWRTIQARVATTTRVCSYDRAGYGFSDEGALPRSAGTIARDLGLLLKAAGERGPYIIVAHSLGGLDARLFAVQHRREVKGMLLVDPTVPRQAEQMSVGLASYRADMEGFTSAVARCSQGIVAGTIKPDTRESRPCVDPVSTSLPQAINSAHRAQQLTAGYQRTAASELQSLAISSRQVEAGQRPYGAMPLIVMTAGKSNFDPDLSPAAQAKLDATWFGLHEQVARLSTRGEHRTVAAASHFIPKDDPDVVVAAIDELVLFEGGEVGGHQSRQRLAHAGIVEIAQAVAAEDLRPTGAVDPTEQDLAGLIRCDDEVAIADARIMTPTCERRLAVVAGHSIIGDNHPIVLGLGAKLGSEVAHHLIRLRPVDASAVPIRHLLADEDTNDNNGELDADRHPVLRSQLGHGPLEDHARCSP